MINPNTFALNIDHKGHIHHVIYRIFLHSFAIILLFNLGFMTLIIYRRIWRSHYLASRLLISIF